MTTDSIRAYVSDLLAQDHERVRLLQMAQEIADQKKLTQLRRARPLDEQIEQLMRELPPAQRDRCWSMSELLPRLSGKYRDRPHSKEVGQALRRLGWHRERRYSQGYDGARVWVLPSPSNRPKERHHVPDVTR